MKIKIDTKYKTISVETPVNLEEFIREIQSIVPDWSEYNIVPNQIEQTWPMNIPSYPFNTPPSVQPPLNPLWYGTGNPAPVLPTSTCDNNCKCN